MQSRPVGSRDYPIHLNKLMKAFWISGERENSPAVFLKVDLRKHLSPGGLIANPENNLGAPARCIGYRLHYTRQRPDELACAFRVYK